jgi:hypothetical protein
MRYFIIILSLGVGALRLASVPIPSAIRFENIAAKAGVNFITRNSPTPNKNQIETMVAGVALLDYDGDGWLDIYLVNGAAIPSLQKESPAFSSPARAIR